MLRRGEISPSLAVFQRAMGASEAMEAGKKRLRRGSRGACVSVLRCEETLDEAWELVADIERRSGPLAADIVAEHWLLGGQWRDVALAHHLAVDRCKKLAYEAVKRLDG